ncbi:MAG TPA: hypothetical protein PLR25_27510, partial [Planctomycetaceae bacterium]|nr:hypothetical protein [Planctomycetaceae bacterium]
VSVVGRLLATRRGYTDTGSVQAKAECQFSAVAYQSEVHRRRVGGARKPTSNNATNREWWQTRDDMLREEIGEQWCNIVSQNAGIGLLFGLVKLQKIE